MNELTNTGLSAISRSHENVMTGLFNLTIRKPRKIEVIQISEEVTLGTQNGIDYHVYPSEER